MNLAIHSAPWSLACESLLAKAMRSEPGVTVATLRAMVEHGEGHLYQVERNQRIVGAYVLRLEHRENGFEGVIVAAAGRMPGASLIAHCLPVIEREQLDGCNTVRVHTARRGMLRELAKHGYRVREIVLEKEITNGRLQ